MAAGAKVNEGVVEVKVNDGVMEVKANNGAVDERVDDIEVFGSAASSSSSVENVKAIGAFLVFGGAAELCRVGGEVVGKEAVGTDGE